MASSRTREVGIRLTVKDKAVVERALKELGAEGEAALRRIQRSAIPASVALTALNKSVGVSRGVLTSFFGAMTPGVVGLLSVAGAVAGVKAALDKFSEINDRSKAAGLDAEYFQGMAAAAKDAGVDIGTLANGLETYAKNVGLAEAGKGKFLTTLKALDPVLTKNIMLATTQEERIRLAADAINAATDAASKQALSNTLFGNGGFAAVFEGGSAALDETIAKARELGLIVSNDVIARADDLGDKFDAVTTVIDVQLKQALIDLGPVLVDLLNMIGQAAKFVNEVNLQRRVYALGAEASSSNDATAMDKWSTGELAEWRRLQEEELAAANKEIARLEAEQANPSTGVQIGQFFDPNVLTRQIADEQAKADNNKAWLDLIEESEVRRGAASTAAEEAARKKAEAARLAAAGDREAAAAAEAAAKADEEQAKRVADVTAGLNAEIAALSMTNEQKFVASQLSKAQVTAAEKEGQAITALAETYYDKKEAIDAANEAATFFASTTESAFENLIDGSKSLTDILGDVANALLKATIQAQLLGTGPLAGLLGTASDTEGTPGGILGSIFSALLKPASPQPIDLFSANGNVFQSKSLGEYRNRVVSTPTTFRFAKGMMGEAGTEGILPLMRDSKGRLGVSSSGGEGDFKVNVNITRQAGAGQDSATATRRGREVDLEAMIYDTVAKGVATPGNEVHKALRRNFSASPQLVER